MDIEKNKDSGGKEPGDSSTTHIENVDSKFSIQNQTTESETVVDEAPLKVCNIEIFSTAA